MWEIALGGGQYSLDEPCTVCKQFDMDEIAAAYCPLCLMVWHPGCLGPLLPCAYGEFDAIIGKLTTDKVGENSLVDELLKLPTEFFGSGQVDDVARLE